MWTEWIDVDQLDWDGLNGPNRLKWMNMDRIDWNGPNWTEVDQNWLNGPKCYADVTQKKRRNNKCYAIIFKYYIDWGQNRNLKHINAHTIFIFITQLKHHINKSQQDI